MAFVTKKGDRFEIRESAHTARGPRSTTLATFRILSEPVLDKAAARATAPFDAEALRRRAVELGAPVARSEAFLAGRHLAGELGRGARLSPALAAHLSTALARSAAAPLDSLDDVVEWVGASVERRGRTLWQLLELADALPKARRRPGLSFPGLVAAAR